ncbi:MAG: glycosyltransferase family 2 protein [Bacteroidales bacterium]|nr:glycosyltransferase family 2 protein [Bacteroidales bacterium]
MIQFTKSISAGIVTYNPDLERLAENVDSISGQVSEVIIFDNCSGNYGQIKERFGADCTIIESPSHRNVGIAAALTGICRYSESHGYEWVLTLDQDSVCPDNIISEYQKYCSYPRVGMISPRIQDRNIGILDDSETETDELDACITSASLVNLSAWKEVGGFWDELFIDMVDFDMCWSMREQGFKILRVNSVSLLHELGHSRKTRFRGKDVAVFNHPPQRYYYIFRNTIAVGRKHHRRVQCFRWNLKRLWLVLRYEDERLPKLASISKGLFDGLFNKLGGRY